MGSQENKLINLYIELRDGLRDLEERFYTIIPMYHRDYTDSPEDFAHEMTCKRYCKAMDEREKAEDARYTLENMVYPHFDIDDIDHVEDAGLEWMNLDAGELEDIKCLMEKLTRKVEKLEAKWKKSQLLIEYYTPCFNLQKKLEIEISRP